jgi:hypothetical protein
MVHPVREESKDNDDKKQEKLKIEIRISDE